MLRHPALALLAAGSMVACIHPREKNWDKIPEMHTGMAATVILPGEAPPVVGAPGSDRGAPGSATLGGAGSSTSSSGSRGPGGESTRGSGSATGGAAATSIGGSTSGSTQREQGTGTPGWLRYAAMPFLLVAAPFKLLYDAAWGEDEPAPAPSAVPTSPEAPPTVAARPSPHEVRERAELERMERELEARQASGALPATGGPSREAATPGSIAAELAALQRRPVEPRSANAPAPRPEAREHPDDTTRRSVPGVAPDATNRNVPEADGIVDRDGDGRVDHWIYREDGRIVRQAFDENFDGRPDRVVHYAAGRRVSRLEEDSDHDGRIDAWSHFENGAMARRRADADGDGEVDTWSLYRDGALARHERDTDGDGFRDRASYYEDGHLAREEQDSDGDGRVDVTTHYDARERPLRRVEDVDGDGQPDVISHYENGRLARRELLDAALLQGAPSAEARPGPGS